METFDLVKWASLEISCHQHASPCPKLSLRISLFVHCVVPHSGKNGCDTHSFLLSEINSHTSQIIPLKRSTSAMLCNLKRKKVKLDCVDHIQNHEYLLTATQCPNPMAWILESLLSLCSSFSSLDPKAPSRCRGHLQNTSFV